MAALAVLVSAVNGNNNSQLHDQQLAAPEGNPKLYFVAGRATCLVAIIEWSTQTLDPRAQTPCAEPSQNAASQSFHLLVLVHSDFLLKSLNLNGPEPDLPTPTLTNPKHS